MCVQRKNTNTAAAAVGAAAAAATGWIMEAEHVAVCCCVNLLGSGRWVDLYGQAFCMMLCILLVIGLLYA